MKKSVTITALFLFLGMNSLLAQTDSSTIKIPMNKLNFVIGEWEGSGWMSTRNGKEYSHIQEKAEYKLGNSIMVVQGLGTKTDSITKETKVVHDAFGIISFNAKNKEYTIRAYKKEGVTESKIEFIEEKIIRWNLELPNGGKVRFTADYREENKWIETGEFSRDGINWMKILGMELKRKVE